MKTIKQFFKKYHELVTIPAVILIFIVSIPVLRWMDPTAGVFDAGVFQIMILALIQLVIFLAIAWIMLGIIFGHHKRYLTTIMKNDFDNLEKWQKLKLTYSIFFLLVALLAYMAKTVAN